VSDKSADGLPLTVTWTDGATGDKVDLSAARVLGCIAAAAAHATTTTPKQQAVTCPAVATTTCAPCVTTCAAVAPATTAAPSCVDGPMWDGLGALGKVLVGVFGSLTGTGAASIFVLWRKLKKSRHVAKLLRAAAVLVGEDEEEEEEDAEEEEEGEEEEEVVSPSVVIRMEMSPVKGSTGAQLRSPALD
jgi:hypothetical protein